METKGRLGMAATKVMYILDAFPGCAAGTEAQLWALLRQMNRNVIAPAVTVLRPSAFLENNLEDIPYDCLHIYRMRSPSSWISAMRFARHLKRIDVKVCHLIFSDSSMLFPIPLRLFGIRVIVWRRDLGHWCTFLNRPLVYINGKFVSKFIVNSMAVASCVKKLERVPNKKIQVIYNGVETNAVDSADADAEPNAAYGAGGEGAVTIGIVANLRPLKRVDDAIRAMKLLSDVREDMNLLVAGSDRPGREGNSHLQELELLVESLGLSDVVHFLGEVTDSRKLIRQCDICLLCSDEEGLSNSVLEYLSEGKAVVVSDIDSNREIVEEGQTGRLYPVGDSQRLAEIILELLDDDKEIERISGKARSAATNRFSMKSMVRNHELAYGAVLESRS